MLSAEAIIVWKQRLYVSRFQKKDSESALLFDEKTNSKQLSKWQTGVPKKSSASA
jgi:hypothetical protein